MLQSLAASFNLTVVAVVVMAGVVRGFSGFGFSLAAVPLLSMILPINTVVPLVLGLEAIGVLPTLGRIWRYADGPLLIRLLVGSVLAMPIGLYVLHVGTPWLLRPLISIMVLVAVILIWKPPNLSQGGEGRTSSVMAGAISGLLNGAAAMSGPPIILFVLSRGSSQESMRATMMLFFSGSAIATLTIGLASVTYAAPEPGLFLWCLPFLALGIEIGNVLRQGVDPVHARRLALAALALSATISLIAATPI